MLCAAGAPGRGYRLGPVGSALTKRAERILQGLGVFGVQVDLVVRTVEAEADRPLSGTTAVKVIDE